MRRYDWPHCSKQLNNNQNRYFVCQISATIDRVYWGLTSQKGTDETTRGLDNEHPFQQLHTHQSLAFSSAFAFLNRVLPQGFESRRGHHSLNNLQICPDLLFLAMYYAMSFTLAVLEAKDHSRLAFQCGVDVPHCHFNAGVSKQLT
jgi:hypothetical protein